MLTVDANVWVAAADPGDVFYTPSREFLHEAARRRLEIYLPTFAWLEIACALARRRQDAEAGRQLTRSLLTAPHVRHVPLDASLLAQALLIGPGAFLRGADALYAATAAGYATQLVSWDEELIRRGGAMTPSDWLTANF